MTAETKIKALVAIISLAAFFFSVVQFLQVQSVSAQIPYLERKLAWCEEAVEKAAGIATKSPPSQEDVARFWQLYWGVMNMIEKDSVHEAMVAFGDELQAGQAAAATSKGDEEIAGLTGLSQALAHASRDELAREWSSSWAR